MKVCMVVFGAINYSVALTSALSKYCEVDFFCSKYHLEKGDPYILNILRENVTINKYGKYRRRDFRNILIYHRLCQEIQSRFYDVIHFQGIGTPWLALSWKKCSKYPLVITVHDPYPHQGLPFTQRFYIDVMQRIFVNRANKIIVHGTILKEQIFKRYPKKTYRDVAVVPHGDFSILKYWDKKKKNNKKVSHIKNILFFGSIRPNKGLEYLLKAEPFIRSHLSNYQIIVAGKCDSFERYEKYIEPNSKIKIINEYIPNKEVSKYFREASVVALPYISATQTGIIPLAYSFGKPVIATTVGAMPEIVEDGKTGFLVAPRNEKVLANAIVRLLTNDNLVKEMGKNALEYSKRNLSWDSIAKKTIKMYCELVQ